MSRGGCLSGGLQSKCGEFRLQFPDRHSPRTDLVVRERADAFLATLDRDDAEPFLEMSPRLVPETWERFRDHALPGIRAVDEDAVEPLSARYVLDAAGHNLHLDRPEASGALVGEWAAEAARAARA